MQDFLSVRGFLFALGLVWRLKEGASFLWMAPVCSSFSWMSRSCTKRSKAYPNGDQCRKSVRDGNIMIARCMLMILFANAKKITWALEQPMNATSMYLDRFQSMLTMVAAHTGLVYLKPFGAYTSKPLRSSSQRFVLSAFVICS